MIGMLFIVGGYAFLVGKFGWWGVAAVAVHLGIMLLAAPRR